MLKKQAISRHGASRRSVSECWDTVCRQAYGAYRRFRTEERGGIEKIIAIAIVVVITASALAAITIIVQDWVDEVPDPATGGDFDIT